MSLSIATFNSKIRNVLRDIKQDPLLLRRGPQSSIELEELKKRLEKGKSKKSKKGKKTEDVDVYTKQGTGNQVTNQEMCFAHVLECYDFKNSESDASEDGYYYKYQVNGTQQSIDFEAYLVLKGEKKINIMFDLKYTTSKVFFLNDGWFIDNVVYIVSWVDKVSVEGQRKKEEKPKTLIAFGQDIPSEEENEKIRILIEFKKKYNSENKGVGNLHIYLRSANTYGCNSFTEDFTEECFKTVMSAVRPPSPKRRVQIESDSSSSSSSSPPPPLSLDVTCGEDPKVTVVSDLTTEQQSEGGTALPI